MNENIPEYLVWHHSDSTWGDYDYLHKIHVIDNGWREVAYNLIVSNGHLKYKSHYSEKNDGTIIEGRGMNFDNVLDPSEVGAHSGSKMNKNSWGICLIGKKIFTMSQLRTALYISAMAKALVPSIKVIGHYQVPGTTKGCPEIDMNMVNSVLNSHNLSDHNIKLYLGGVM